MPTSPCYGWFESGLSIDFSKDSVRTIGMNYWLIALIFKKCANLPLCLENYALFSLPPIFTKTLYTYTLSNIFYLGEPSGNIISNYHGTSIHIFMYGYCPFFKVYIKRFFCQCYRFICRCIFFLTNVTSKIFHILRVEFFS